VVSARDIQAEGARSVESYLNNVPQVFADHGGNMDDNPAGQYHAIFGGAANLKPEKSDSYTLGLILTPTCDLSFTVDAFDITVKG
jgi:iron complex outermembrane receptor protein